MARFFLIGLLFFILFSCKKESVTDIVLTASKDEITADGQDKITFTVTDSNGDDITKKAQLFKNNEPFNETTFVGDKAGTYYFRAEFDGLVSNTKTIEVQALILHLKNILIEDYTGTWCGYCPRVANAIKNILTHRDNIDVIAIHDDNQMGFSQVELLKQQFEIDGFPTAIIDRTYKWPYPEEEGGLSQALKRPANCGIALETSVENKKATIKVKVEFARGYDKLSKLAVYITENNLSYSQANFYPEYGSNPIPNFVHNHVLRKSLTNVMGDNIDTDFNSVYSRTFVVDLQKYKLENISVVAFVIDNLNSETLNSRTAKLTQNADFQYIN